MTMKVSKGLVFPVAALPGVGHMPAMVKASRRLVISVSGNSPFGQRLT